MRKIVTKEVRFCDGCGQEDLYPDACLGCGVEMCYECKKKHGKHYSHSVYCQGSGDGFYCKPCDTKLTIAGTDRRHAAYRAIEFLKSELEAWHADFKERQEMAEKAVRKLTP